MVALWILDLALVPQAKKPADALHNMLDVAWHAEVWS
jgi:hypothetical protein